MNLRQVHLDFHTSEKISGIGSKFDKKQFQEALIKGHVNSITLFSKCHHGWSYHPTKVNEMHPELDFDLLGAQIEAAHEIGVKTPVYISAGLDEKYARKHRGEVVRNKDESTLWAKDFTEPGYHKLCMNTPYLDSLLAEIKEVCENYDADGIFLDIMCVQPCYCEHCMNQLFAEGKNPNNIDDVLDLAERVYANYTKKVRETIDSVKPGLPVFHNGGHIRHGRRDIAFANTHIELESLPTGGWGYDHFPVSAAYTRTLGMEYLGMTGKFHTSWGEFGGFKHPNALRYETALSVANGAGCSIGDQLHPNGQADMATYELIGEAYKEIEEKEEYLIGAKNIADIAVISTEAYDNYCGKKPLVNGSNVSKANAGCGRILIEGKYLFNYVDFEEDFSKYKLIIMPDEIKVDDEITKKLKDFINNGGKILASGVSGIDENNNFAFDFGCDFDGENGFEETYCRPCFEIDSLRNSAYIMYSKAYNVKNVTGDVLADCENPYFNRRVEHFCSHKHAPNDFDSKHPAVVKGNDGVYIGWNIFNEYATVGQINVKEAVSYIIDDLLDENKTLKTSLPAQGVATVTKQNDRKIVHLLYASPVCRGNGIEIIEDIVPVFNINVSVKCDKEPSRVYLAPQNKDIEYKVCNGRIEFVVPEVNCHQIIVIE